jgi:biopolymer transport protein ExbB/TolQ
MAHGWVRQRTHAAALVVPCGTFTATAAVLPPQPLVTVPILAAGAFALVAATRRIRELARVPVAAPRELESCVAALGAGDREAAAKCARALAGPVGEHAALAVHHLDEPADRVDARLAEHRAWVLGGLQAAATGVAWVASVAPLLGLLGTLSVFTRSLVFTVFDVGDPVALAASRASAFVSLHYGIAAGAPAWLVHLLHARRVRRVAQAMDAAGAALLAGLRAMPRAPR